MSEPPEVTAQRDTAKKTLEVLNKARRIIRREVSQDERVSEIDKSKPVDIYMEEKSFQMHL